MTNKLVFYNVGGHTPRMTITPEIGIDNCYTVPSLPSFRQKQIESHLPIRHLYQ